MNKIPIDEIFHSPNEEMIPISEMEDRNQKVVIFDDYVCEKNQNNIINYFIQGRHKNCCVIYLSQSYYKTPKDIRIKCSHYIILKVLLNGRMNQYVISVHLVISIQEEFKIEHNFLYIDKPRKTAKRNFNGGL